jgi:tetratricopeptide (TPR) repeat protein
MVAIRASFDGNDAVIPWTAAVLDRARVYGPAHFLLGRVLRETYPAQARLEYRLAMEQAPELSGRVVKDARPLATGYDEIMEIVPERGADELLGAFASAIVASLPATQSLLDQELLRRDPSRFDSRLRIARELQNAVEQGGGAPWCDDTEACRQQLLDAARELAARVPGRWEGHVLLARALAHHGDPRAALNELRDATAKVDRPSACIIEEVRIARTAELDGDLDAALDQLTRLACATDDECAGHLVFAADVESQRKRLDRALAIVSKAVERYPTNEQALELMGRLSSQLGLHARAMEAYQKLGRLHPADKRYVEAADRERAAIGTVQRR